MEFSNTKLVKHSGTRCNYTRTRASKHNETMTLRNAILFCLFCTSIRALDIISENGVRRSLVETDDGYVDVIVKFVDDAVAMGGTNSTTTNLRGFRTLSQVNTTARIPLSVQNLITTYSTEIQVTSQLERTNAIAMSLPSNLLDTLLNDPSVQYVEPNNLDYPLQYQTEINSWGVSATKADAKCIPNTQAIGSCFKVCIIDSGLYVDHPDIPYTRGSPMIRGADFSLPSGQRWDNPQQYHGSHIAGIMVAKGGNGIGITGTMLDAPSTNNICLLVARIFDDDGNGKSTATAASAAEWCVDNGAKVINMSLGSPDSYSTAIQDVYRTIRYKEGVLVFASAGNAGDTKLNYPASYYGVISVGAVQKDLSIAPYSVRNREVDLVAPGTDIISTITEVVVYDAARKKYKAFLVTLSATRANVLSGYLADCGKAQTTCQNVAGKICFITRGGLSLTDKVKNCSNGGGIGAVIANNVKGPFSGKFTSRGAVQIPAITVSMDAGINLKKSLTVAISFQTAGYRSRSGTSVASPYVAGVAAKIWSVRPQCTADQIEAAMFRTARDLGPPGRDDTYGHGLVQADAAYNYLMTFPPPCGR